MSRSVHSDRIRELRNLQVRLNESVAIGYGFEDIDLAHGFHEVDYLPTGENARFTISETARAGLLSRLASLNKVRFEQQDKTASKSVKKLGVGSIDYHSDDDLFVQSVKR